MKTAPTKRKSLISPVALVIFTKSPSARCLNVLALMLEKEISASILFMYVSRHCSGVLAIDRRKVLVNVLKVREDLAFQLAFLSTELAEIFASAPVTTISSDAAKAQVTNTGGSRKPIEGDCPVCVMEFDESDKPEDILWCKGACGQNIHRTCFEQWARSKPGQVKCVYCRTAWKGDENTIENISKSGSVNHEGYVNVAGELGISGHRDMSTYHQYWVRREFGGGYSRYGDDDGY